MILFCKFKKYTGQLLTALVDFVWNPLRQYPSLLCLTSGLVGTWLTPGSLISSSHTGQNFHRDADGTHLTQYCIAMLEVDFVFIRSTWEWEKLPLKFSLTLLSEEQQTIVVLSLVYFTLVRDCRTKNAEKVSASEYWETKNYISVQFPHHDRLHRHMAIFLFYVIVIHVIFFCCFVVISVLSFVFFVGFV